MASIPPSLGGQPLPLYLSAQQPAERNRLTAALRLIWVIPQAIVLYFVYIAAFFVAIVGWFGALFTGELPGFAEDFLSGVVRWGARVSGYFYFLTDDYPAYTLEQEPNYAIQIAVPPRVPLNRLAVLFRIILVIPGAIVAGLAGSGLGVLSVGSWFMITFTGAQPIPLYEATRTIIRFQVRLAGYFWMLTAEYHWGLLGDATATNERADGSGWEIQLSDGGRYAVIAALVIGVIYALFNYA